MSRSRHQTADHIAIILIANILSRVSRTDARSALATFDLSKPSIKKR